MRSIIPLSIPTTLAIAVVIAGCGSGSSSGSSESSASSIVAPYPKIELPSAGGGCNGPERSEGATTIPVKVAKVGEGIGVLANVCVGSRGPFPFIVDTGAAETIVSSRLADELHLARVGAPTQAGGGSCITRSQKVKLPAWSVAGVPLRAQTVLSIDAPLYNGKEQLEGSIGADVLSRFGAVRVDYKGETLTVDGKEGSVAKDAGVTRSSAKPLPIALVKGQPKITAPMAVSDVAGSVTQMVKVAFDGGKAQEWSPDTGAWISYIKLTESKRTGLRLTGRVIKERTFCSIRAVLTAESGEWTLAGKPLKPQPIGSTPFVSVGDAQGLLGSRTLNEFGSVVFDWAGGRLLLGVG